VIGDILQPTHLLLILIVALLVLGPKRLPEVGRTLGKGLRDFRHALSFDDDEREAMAIPNMLDPQQYTATPVRPEQPELGGPATTTMPGATVPATPVPAPATTQPTAPAATQASAPAATQASAPAPTQASAPETIEPSAPTARQATAPPAPQPTE
jgi:TatA/E family protein of Tat protein translocase